VGVVGDDEGHSTGAAIRGSWHCFEMLGAGKGRDPKFRLVREGQSGDFVDDGDCSSMAHLTSLYESVIDYKCVLFAF
jgi:hypothetical protein